MLKQFDEAESLYRCMDRLDMTVDMHVRLGDCFAVETIPKPYDHVYHTHAAQTYSNISAETNTLCKTWRILQDFHFSGILFMTLSVWPPVGSLRQ